MTSPNFTKQHHPATATPSSRSLPASRTTRMRPRIPALLAAALSILPLSCSGPRTLMWANPGIALGRDFSKTVVYVPLETADTVFLDNTGMTSHELVDHQLFLDAANALLISEISRRFRLVSRQDTIGVPSDTTPHGFSKLSAMGDSADAAAFIQTLARESNVHLVAIARRCSLTTKIFQPTAWRDGKYEGGTYDRPVTRTVAARMHLQLWTADGRLAFEKVGVGTAKAPMLYDQLRKKRKEQTDLVRYARRWYAPPALRAALLSAQDALREIR